MISSSTCAVDGRGYGEGERGGKGWYGPRLGGARRVIVLLAPADVILEVSPHHQRLAREHNLLLPGLLALAWDPRHRRAAIAGRTDLAAAERAAQIGPFHLRHAPVAEGARSKPDGGYKC